MMGLMKYLVVLAAFGFSGCVAQEGSGAMSNDGAENKTVFAEILAENRARLRANAAALQSVGKTSCGGGYALELFAPRAIRFTAALRQSTAAPEDALFWVLRVPDSPTLSEVSITVPNAWDKPDWYAERRDDEGWVPIRKPESNGTAHASLVDAPATFQLADAQGDIVLPVPLAGPLPRVMADPEPGNYRIHFAPFTATIGGVTCKFEARAWGVTLR
jgi:hypothetical protein